MIEIVDRLPTGFTENGQHLAIDWIGPIEALNAFGGWKFSGIVRESGVRVDFNAGAYPSHSSEQCWRFNAQLVGALRMEHRRIGTATNG